MDTPKTIMGNLDTGLMCYQRATDTIEEQWKSKEKRMRMGDIERAKRYCRNMTKYVKRINATLKQFEGIAEKEEVIIGVDTAQGTDKQVQVVMTITDEGIRLEK